MADKLVPKVRFKGFVDDWELRKLGDLYHTNKEKNSIGIKFNSTISISSMRFKNDGNGAKQSSLSNYKVLRLGDLAYEGHSNKNFSFGRFVLDDIGTGIMSPRFATLRPVINMDISYWKNYMHYEPIMRHVLVRSTKLGTMMNELVITDLNKQEIKVPSNNEQKKIGKILFVLENTINLQQRQLDLYKKLKQGLLQKLFPVDSEKVPVLRFADFHADWEQHKLSELVKITMGQSPNSKNYTKNSSDHILVQGNADLKGGYVVPRVWTTQVTKTAEKKDLILSVRAPVGDIGKTNYAVVLGRGVAGIKGNEFIYQILFKMNLDGYWTKYSTGSTFDSINSDNIANASIIIPKDMEQTQIGKLLKTIDNIILLQQDKLDYLQRLKSSFLQNLFI